MLENILKIESILVKFTKIIFIDTVEISNIILLWIKINYVENLEKIREKQKLLPELRFASIATDSDTISNTKTNSTSHTKSKEEGGEISVNEYTYEFLGKGLYFLLINSY